MLQRGHVEIGLIDTHILHDRREAPQNVFDQTRDAAVLLVVDAQEDAVGAQFVRGTQRHCGMHAKLACLIRCRGYDSALRRVATAADHDRLARQLRTTQQLHGREEGVHVDVKNAAGLGHARDCLAVREWFKASAAVVLSYRHIGITEVSK